MKNLVAFSALFFVSMGMFAQANVTSKITQVTVYLQGAQLVHTAETQVSQGKQTVVFTGLSADMQPESVVLECGNKNVVFQSVSIRNNYLKEQTPNAKIAELQEKSALVEEKLATLTEEIGSLFNFCNRHIVRRSANGFVAKQHVALSRIHTFL
jgi:hypothetical protein